MIRQSHLDYFGKWSARARRGLSAIEVIVVLAILGLFVLCGFMILPRRRETARMDACQRNLMQIGMALGLYDQSQGLLPSVPELASPDAAHAVSPLKALLVELGVPDFRELTDTTSRPPKRADLPQGQRRVPGFLCPSDSNAVARAFPAPVNYRATTGDDAYGRNGPFAPGRHLSMTQVEAADGSSYTAGFSERLVGNNRSEHRAQTNYALAPGPLPASGCPAAASTAWRGDAGNSWLASDWQSTLYNHVLTPNAEPSCITDDRRSAVMGASSGHADGVNVLFFDFSVRTFTPSVAPKIWREWASVPEPPR
jgi:prepilin-type N-terminal cleavage/methylation domain-containing protein/prepilin-type processing-associated H-X9-DG protein